MQGANAAEKNKRYILVVNSDIEDCFFTCMLLQRFGYPVFTAYTTEKAVEFMTVTPPSAVVADAGAAGAALLPWLSQDPRFFDIPLLLLSWWPDAALEERARTGEIAAFLRKPIDVVEFYRTVQAAMEKSPRRNIRIASHLPVRLEDEPGGSQGFITEISEHGMFFRTLKPRPVKTRIPVAIEINGKLIRLEAEVLYTITFEEGPFKEPGMGMKFVQMSRADRKLIAAFILDRIEEGIAQQSAKK